MELRYTKTFRKAVGDLPLKKRQSVARAIATWISDPTATSLRQHDLHGEYEGQFSISAGGDLRIHMLWIRDHSIVRVITVGTHSQLYR